MRLVDLICRPDARHRFIIGLAAGAAMSFALHGPLGFPNEVVAGWNAFALVVIALDWLTILTTPQRKIRELAQQQDLSRFLIFVFVVVAACAALFAVGFLVSRPKEQTAGVHMAFTLLTVASSWTLVHTVFSLRYAHAFYGDSDVSGVHHHAGGLTFPGDPDRPDRPKRLPDYLDFAYFSFGIGMTCQVSDVQINSPRMRRLALVHSVLSFGFNTIILALLINTVSGLLQRDPPGKS
jgi:uncharacterized membrane protein